MGIAQFLFPVGQNTPVWESVVYRLLRYSSLVPKAYGQTLSSVDFIASETLANGVLIVTKQAVYIFNST